jgi:NTE family protein
MLTVSKHRISRILQVLVFVCLTFSIALQGQEKAPPCKGIGLALSGGGALGAAHIGVLKVLEEEHVKIDCIAGTSFGAIVGGLYASGYLPNEIETLLLNHWQEVFSNQAVRSRAPLIQNQKLRQLVRLDVEGFKPSLPRGILRGQHLIELLSRLTLEPMLAAHYDFDRLPTPFRAVATDLLTGKPYIFKSGRLSEAANASMALPVFFSPIDKDELVLVDGGLADNLPADIVRDMGAQVVIAVDATSPESTRVKVRNILNVMQQAIGLPMKSTTKSNYAHADLVIRPKLDGFSNTSYKHMPEIIKRGISEAKDRTEEIRKLAGEKNLGKSPQKTPPVLNPIIDSIKFETTSPSRPPKIPSTFLLSQVKSKPGDKILPESLSADVERLYASGMFDNVDYICRHVAENRYSLVFLLTESSLNNLGISLLYDREYDLQALAEFSAHTILGTPSHGLLSARLGEIGHKTASLRLIHPRLPFLFIEPQAQILTHEHFEISSQLGKAEFLDKRRGVQVMLGTTILNRFEASAGYRFETERFVPKGVRNDNVPGVNLSGLRLRLRLDTLDKQEFPRSGIGVDIKGDLKTPKLGADLSYSMVQGEIKSHFSPTDKTTFTLRLAAFKSGGNLPAFEQAHLGGYGFSDTSSFRFAGYERDKFAVPHMALAGVAYRRQLFMLPVSFIGRGYLSAEYSLARMNSSGSGISSYGRTAHGGAIGIALDTWIGPIRLAAGMGEAGKPKFYLSMGPSF